MQLEVLATLAALRELYSQPRDPARFRRYLELLTGGGDDLALPITAANPMARPHVLAHVEALLALDAEAVVAEELTALAGRADEPGRLRVAVVVADDIAGGWTNRYTTDAQHRFESAGFLVRDFAAVLLFVSEPPTLDRLREEARSCVHRATYQRANGRPRTLLDHLRQEREVLTRANASFPLAPLDEGVRARVRGHGTASDPPTIYACLYGDEAARQLGYAPLGLPPWAGLALARSGAKIE